MLYEVWRIMTLYDTFGYASFTSTGARRQLHIMRTLLYTIDQCVIHFMENVSKLTNARQLNNNSELSIRHKHLISNYFLERFSPTKSITIIQHMSIECSYWLNLNTVCIRSHISTILGLILNVWFTLFHV